MKDSFTNEQLQEIVQQQQKVILRQEKELQESSRRVVQLFAALRASEQRNFYTILNM